MQRNHLVGASDAKTIAYGTDQDWAELRQAIKSGEGLKFSLNQRFLMDLGSAVEPVTMKRFNDTVTTLSDEQVAISFSEDHRIGATLDGVTVDGKIVEAKFHTGDKDVWELADYYNPQLQHQMLLHGSDRMYFTVTFGRYGKFEAIEIEADADFQADYMQRLTDFMTFLDSGEMPETEPAAPAEPPQPRTHHWTLADNRITDLCLTYLENEHRAKEFEEAKSELKKEFPDDYTQAVWTGDGYEVAMKKDRRGAIRFSCKQIMEAAE